MSKYLSIFLSEHLKYGHHSMRLSFYYWGNQFLLQLFPLNIISPFSSICYKRLISFACSCLVAPIMRLWPAGCLTLSGKDSEQFKEPLFWQRFKFFYCNPWWQRWQLCFECIRDRMGRLRWPCISLWCDFNIEWVPCSYRQWEFIGRTFISPDIYWLVIFNVLWGMIIENISHFINLHTLLWHNLKFLKYFGDFMLYYESIDTW